MNAFMWMALVPVIHAPANATLIGTVDGSAWCAPIGGQIIMAAPGFALAKGDTSEVFEYAAIVVGHVEVVPCSIACGPGFYACCSDDSGHPSMWFCECRPNESSPDGCKAGGPGIATCTIAPT